MSKKLVWTLLVAGVAAGLGACTYKQYPPDYPPYVYAPPAVTSASPTAPPDCREYQSQVVIDGKSEQLTGHACRTADGRWQLTD